MVNISQDSLDNLNLSPVGSKTQGSNWPHFSTCNFACHCQEWDIFFASSIDIFCPPTDKVLWCQDLLKTEDSELRMGLKSTVNRQTNQQHHKNILAYADEFLGILKGNLPTTMRTLVWVAVWKSGASPDTSHRNLPLVVRSTFLNTILVSVDLYSW